MWYSLPWYSFSCQVYNCRYKDTLFWFHFSVLHHLVMHMNSKLEDTSHCHCLDWGRNSVAAPVWESSDGPWWIESTKCFISVFFFSLPPWTSRHFLRLQISPNSSHRVKILGPLEPEDTWTSISSLHSSDFFSLQEKEERSSIKYFPSSMVNFLTDENLFKEMPSLPYKHCTRSLSQMPTQTVKNPVSSSPDSINYI